SVRDAYGTGFDVW
nr:immunoglobulin heavy chain junction region [Macaca mulatta]MOV38119.1 immunoglobulin heavy chain junction region [Macaca mulatta]MOV38222.1 immunoglobulin heavy chain junction region [Macaca mulatta]MOV41139.1 immunoglobulin heavy chain junction region [Macaca mulatta]MOV44843.1 immunoglobulin heavy chain junction region [Macaca mulatta]